MRRGTGHIRLVITMALVAAMPICCCEGRMVLGRMLSALVMAPSTEVASASAGGCCSGGAERLCQDVPTTDHEDGLPVNHAPCRCADQPKFLAHADTGVLILAPAVVLIDVWPIWLISGDTLAQSCGPAAPDRPPTSLLSLHCALRT
jgi:hypothetical protein